MEENKEEKQQIKGMKSNKRNSEKVGRENPRGELCSRVMIGNRSGEVVKQEEDGSNQGNSRLREGKVQHNT